MSDPNQQTNDAPIVDLSGRQLGDYRLLRRLGRGAMAEVYLAEQRSLTRQVALKVLKTELAKDQTYVQRFQREARAAASLVHANIVQIHEVGCIDEVYFIVQEYVQGLNLRQWITRKGPLDLRMILIIMRQVAAALAKAAEQGIVHRDVKPENIMLTRSGEVKVADFGLARVARGGDPVDLTQAGMTMGTPLYMSPEQVEGQPLDPRSDLYSFGVTCYHMLAGTPPFGGETALSVAVQHLKKKPVWLENVRPDLPPALCRIVHKMLAKDREKRHQSAQELLKELRQVQLEHLDEEWPEHLPGWEVSEGDATGASRNETTQRLQSLMKTASASEAPRLGWLLWALGVLAALGIGAAVSYYALHEAPLLAQTQDESAGVRQYKTAELQFTYAVMKNTPEAYQAVIDNFGTRAYYVNRAKKQLAWHHLMHGDYDAAKEIFEGFRLLDNTEVELQAFGLAGQCWVLTQRGDYEEALKVLSESGSILDELDDYWMDQMFRRALEEMKNKGSGAGIAQELLDKLEQEQDQESTAAD
ncbi:MAG: protein kinase domain-containing protein [Planctomycetota bacterium]|jgi:serine/threonine-protein kinase